MRTICYYPELVKITGSINAALMMAQLEFWFKVVGGKPFYKFLEPCMHDLYKIGDSWSEELGMTSAEIRSAFKRIGTMYKSKSAFLKAAENEDVFKGKPYAAYYDRMRKTTYYLRDEDKVDTMFPQDLLTDCPNRTCISVEQEGSSYNRDKEETECKDVHLADRQIETCSNTFCVTKESEGGLYRDNYIDDNINNSIKESQKESHSLIPYGEIVNLYNDHLGDKLGYMKQLTSKDKVSIKKLWCQLNIQLGDFKQGFIKAAESRFLCGKVEGKRWKASFKWLLEQDHLIKVMQGLYDDFKTSNTETPQKNRWDKIQQFNQMESHHFDFDEIERLERQYIDRKLEGWIGQYQLGI